MRYETRKTKRWAFTIVELLTVMGVIALLIGLLAPALNAVRRVARDTKQKAQFNSIKAGIEMFRADQGDYPESAAIDGTGQTGFNAGAPVITGSQRLAEALLGRDLQGYDTVSKWHPNLDLTATPPTNAYGGLPPVAAELTKSLDRRKGPYLDLENVGAFNIDQLYGTGTTIYGATDTLNPASNEPAPLITDVYTDKTITVKYYDASNNEQGKSVRVGTPVLYYKANTERKDLRKQAGTTNNYADCTYNYYDNDDILNLGKISSSSIAHPMKTPEIFYDKITNYQIPNNEGVAYRSDSYILMSAGRNGLFGDADDIYNFGD
jgi:type II secretory pathway pseudopilin PulG